MASRLNISVSEAREIVLGVSRENGWHEPELEATTDPRVLASIAHLRRQVADIVETIAEDIGSVRGRFILELTQNVEDCSFEATNSVPWLSFEVHPERIVVTSNQDGFDKTDVVQICRTGRSWKRQQHGFVGEKGIGFKAVFQVASRVHIQSNAFSFYFVYRRNGTVEERLGLVTPLLADDPIPVNERPLTKMTLTPNNIRYENLVAHFDNVHPTLLLFLSKLRKISITVHRQPRGTTVTTFRKEVPVEDTPANLIRLIKVIEGGTQVTSTEPEISRYYIFRTQVAGLSEDEARPDRTGCELVLAFQVDESDHPVIPTQYDVFAYLPVGNFGFKFLIQADFILQASREEVKSDSEWNNDILKAIAANFCNAVLDFCRRDGPLRYRWVEYLPSRRTLQTHLFWGQLLPLIIDWLKNTDILYLHESSELRKPEDVRTLPSDYLDDQGLPLFRDRPGGSRKYLSLEYGRENTQILKEMFEIEDIDDLAMCHRIGHDLRLPDSRMQSGETSDAWHSKAAGLIMSILERSRGANIERMICETLPLIPLNDGSWVSASTRPYFPAETGPVIPRDLVLTIDPESTQNPAREHLFEALGARECAPDVVVGRLWEQYSTRDGAADLASSRLHLSYLYWYVEDISDPGFLHLWIYDDMDRRVNTRRTDVPVYLPSADEYGPQALFRGALPELVVSFLNPAYLRPLSPITRHTRHHDMSWSDWLIRALDVRDVPRLKFSAGSLSTEFRYILQYRPDKVIGTLKKYWPTYRSQMRLSIKEEIKAANVSCCGGTLTQLQFTYFPSEDLVNVSVSLGIVSRFPFLNFGSIQHLREHPEPSEDWAFLRRFEVQFEANITFYLEVLYQHEIGPQKTWDEARADILNTYSSISDNYSQMNRDNIVEAFHQKNLILDPSCFQSGSDGPRWMNMDSCVWKGPEDILDKTPLYSVSEYRTNRKIVRLFHQEILGIQNADWHDYIRTLSKLKTDPNPLWDIADRAGKLYRLIFGSRISDEDWNSIRTFEDEGLVYVSSINQWYSPSRCLWSSPVPVEGMAVIGTDYPGELAEFFLTSLQISPASLSTLVEALRALGGRNSSVERVKEMIKAINRKEPRRQSLEPLAHCNVLPLRRYLSNGGVTLGTAQEVFAITDNTKISSIFQDNVDLLDFSLEEVHELAPFLEALELQSKYLSRMCTTQTACEQVGTIDHILTGEFRDRAYEILRVAVSNRTTKPARMLYDRLLSSSILKTDSISTVYTLNHTNGDITGPVSRNTGHVHIRDQENGWLIFVPRGASDREVSYRTHLPESLAKVIEIPKSCREHISLVLNSSISVIDDLLETVGVGHVPSVEALRRRVVSNLAEETEEDVAVLPSEAMRRATTDELFGVLQSGRVRSAMSESVSTPPSNVSSPQLLPEQGPPNLPNISIQNIFDNADAYTQLLGHVIRIATRTSLPRSGFLAAPENGHHLPGYDHIAAFGVRGLDQMTHDSKVGAAGELFVFEILKNTLGRSFGRENWRSTMRRLVTVHPNYDDLTPWNEPETSDIVYIDNDSHLTRLLIQLGYLGNTWAESEPEYFIEVKTTTGNCADRFFMSHKQYDMMQEKQLHPGRTSAQIYMICRVYDLGKDSMNLKIYFDPEGHRRRETLLFAANWTVRSRA